MDAATLRIILLVVGVAFLIGLFLWERRRTAQADLDDEEPFFEPLGAEKREPNLGRYEGLDQSSLFGDEPARAGGPPQGDLTGILTPLDDGAIAQIYIVSQGGVLSGPEILAAAERHQLRPGVQQIFHRLADAEAADGPALFSMANLVRPGYFPLENAAPDAMEDFETPGIALFTQIRRQDGNRAALDAMLSTAQALAKELAANVEDSHHRTITFERIQALRNYADAADTAYDGSD